MPGSSLRGRRFSTDRAAGVRASRPPRVEGRDTTNDVQLRLDAIDHALAGLIADQTEVKPAVIPAESDHRPRDALDQRLGRSAGLRHPQNLATLAVRTEERGHVELVAVAHDDLAHDVRVGTELLERLREARALARRRLVAGGESVVVALLNPQHEVRGILGALVLTEVGHERGRRALRERHLPRLADALGEHLQVLAVGLERQDLVHVRRDRRRPVVVTVQQADIDADVEPSVGTEADAVEALELLRGGIDRLLARERRSVPARPLLQLPTRPLGREHGAADVQRALMPGQPRDENRRSGDQRRRAVLEHEHAPVRRVRRVGTAVALEYAASAEGERGWGGEARGHHLNGMTVRGLRGWWASRCRGHRGSRQCPCCNRCCGDQRRGTSTHRSAPFGCATSPRRLFPPAHGRRELNTEFTTK